MDKAIVNYLEYELRRYKTLKQHYLKDTNTISNRIPGETVLKAYKQSEYQRRMITAIEETYNRMDQVSKTILECYYFDKSVDLNSTGMANKLHISKREFYNMKRIILDVFASNIGI